MSGLGPTHRHWSSLSPGPRLAKIALVSLLASIVLSVASGLALLSVRDNDDGVPRRQHWESDQAAFDGLAHDLPAPPPPGSNRTPFSVPNKVGSYELETIAYRVTCGAMFYDAGASTSSHDKGFAYLPDGPAPSVQNSSFGQPRFRHLGGAWYSWAAHG